MSIKRENMFFIHCTQINKYPFFQFLVVLVFSRLRISKSCLIVSPSGNIYLASSSQKVRGRLRTKVQDEPMGKKDES